MGQGEILAQHVERLCAEHGIQILERHRYGGAAWKKSRTIAIMPVKTQRTYIVALHEIGHIVGRGRSGTRLEQEAAAWNFVLQHAIVPLSPATYRQMLKYLTSYLYRASRSRSMSVPAPDHWFWDTYTLIQSRAS